MPESSSKTSVPAEVLSRTLDGESVLLDLRSGRYFGLNGTGSFLWDMIRGGLERDEMAARLRDEFDVEIDNARADVDQFISGLVSRGLIKNAAGG